MKIFFISTPRGNNAHAQLIYKTIIKLGHVHTSKFHEKLRSDEFYEADQQTWEKRYLKRIKEITRADVCIFEVSQHSLAVGQLVQEAIRSEKPVILLHYEDKKPYFFQGTAEAEKRAQLIEYSIDDLDEVLKYALEIAEELLTTRFTLLLPSDIVNFLDDTKKNKGISKSDYIRTLIREEMNKKK